MGSLSNAHIERTPVDTQGAKGRPLAGSQTSSPRFFSHPTEVSLISSLFILGILTNLFFSRLGFMPLDNSIVFDGGWRILCGQVPFVDFVTPTSIVPSAIQALFFRVFGVTWFAYCLHSSIVNGLFCILVFLLLKALDVPRNWSLFYAALSSLAFYVPIGVPYAEQHAFFFLTLALYLAVVAPRNDVGFVKAVLYCAVSVMLVVAFFCKQIPSVPGTPIVLMACVYFSLRTGVAGYSPLLFFWLVAGLAVSLLILLVFVLALKIDISMLTYYFLKLPAQARVDRLWEIATPNFGLQYYAILRDLDCASPILVHASLLSILFLVCNPRLRSEAAGLANPLVKLLLANMLTALSVFFCLLTDNQPLEGFPYLFLCIGLLHSFVSSAFGSKTNVVLRQWLLGVIVVVAVVDAGFFAYYPGLRRKANDIWFVSKDSSSLKTTGLSFMRYLVPEGEYHASANDLDGVADFFRRNKGNFLLIGDYSILYGITGRPSIAPSLWFHPGLTMPVAGTTKFQQYERQLAASMLRYHVKYLVLEGEQTFMKVRLSDFPVLSNLVSDSACREFSFGGFRIIELCGSGRALQELGRL